MSRVRHAASGLATALTLACASDLTVLTPSCPDPFADVVPADTALVAPDGLLDDGRVESAELNIPVCIAEGRNAGLVGS